ncbi:hypothetical protein [Bacillus sp. RAR_GA_16]|uniref:hypothetical protein n=1 Tax=Bacillus sp. RAR_GA_16 TaxID=2876774 RepID=UPI001CCDF963|nr:hypothetical protein [Bacillus sp. RAR_GA_16]MCA0170435.1 hypothetical protein [Bacillus sp. RAR_GA_16]
MAYKNMTEEEMEKEIIRLQEVVQEQNETYKKLTGEELFQRVKTDGKGTVIVDSNDRKQRKMWDIDEE